MKKIILGLVALLAMTSAQAITLKFEFDVNSSGSSIYPCNAGLKHTANKEKICYNRVDKQACNPATQCKPEDTSCNCVCTGTNGGANHVDFFSATYSDWSDSHQDLPATSDPKSVKAATSGSEYNTLFESSVTKSDAVKNTAYFEKQLRSLTFNLGSEKFGAEYFLDVCFRGPQIDYYNANVKSNWVAKTKATIQNVTGDAVYADLSDLNVKSEIVCELQDGSEIVANEVPGVGGLNEFVNEYGVDAPMIPWTSLRAGNENAKKSLTIVPNRITVPKFCKVRYYFKEAVNTGDYKEVRPWTLQQAKVCTETSIEEP